MYVHLDSNLTFPITTKQLVGGGGVMYYNMYLQKERRERRCVKSRRYITYDNIRVIKREERKGTREKRLEWIGWLKTII